MEKKGTGSFNLGKKGWIIVLLGFVSCYCYSTLTSDSLNITIGAFGEMGLNVNILYSLSTVATILGIIGSILFGKLMAMKTASKMWAVSMICTGIFAFVWSRAHTIVIYCIGYFVCYVLTLVSAMLLSYQVIANWFPTKRGIAVGFSTAGMPVSAATSTTVCSKFLASSGIGTYYIFVGVIALIIGFIVLAFSKDFPEEKNAYPDNNHNYDFDAAKRAHEKNLEYLKTSKWTIGACLKNSRMWLMWLAVGITGFCSMGIMANFYNKFIEQQYEAVAIFGMLAIVGIVAIPGSMFIGWVDVKIGTKKTTLLVNVLCIIALAFNITNIHALHYCSLPILAVMLGGSSNMMVSCTLAIWGRYDFQNAFRVIQPLNAIMTGVGITVVGLIGVNVNYLMAYKFMMILVIVGVIATALLKVEPIDENVRKIMEG